MFSQKNVWFTPRLDIRAKPKGNEVTTTKWMVGGGEKMVINFLCNKVICVCPSTLQAFHFGKNSSSVTKKNLLEPNEAAPFWHQLKRMISSKLNFQLWIVYWRGVKTHAQNPL